MGSSIYSEWGSIFGLKACDLTADQLAKVEFSKLIEFAEDPRAEAVLCEQIKTVELGKIRRMRDSKVIANCTKLIAAYNDRLRSIKEKETKKSSYGYGDYSYRSDYVFWDYLDEDNRLREISKWSTGEDSIVSDEKVDYKWLFANHYTLANEIVANVLKKCPNQYRREDTIGNLLRNLPEAEIAKIVPVVQTTFDKDCFTHVLSNPKMPDNYIIAALKVIAKRVGSPRINVSITEPILRALAPITRLEALENIYRNYNSNYGPSPFSGIKEEDLRALLFSAITKHPTRVEELINGMKNRSLIK